jgi:transcriptional regulator with XRE-family HTH domain
MTHKILGVVGASVLFLAFPLMREIHGELGAVPMALLSMVLMGAAVAALLDDVRGALRDAGYSQKSAAITVGVSEPTFANWMSGKERAPLSMLANLGPEFQVALAKRQIARHSDCAVIERGPLCDLVNSVQSLVAEQRRPRMQEVA